MEIQDDSQLPPLISPLVVVRGVVRFVVLVTLVILSLIYYWLTIRHKKANRIAAQAVWLHRLNRRVAKLMSIRITTQGNVPAEGLLVANHLSYTDIIMLSSIAPFAFVSKAEVANWPIFGMCAKCGGTVFVDRQKRGDVLPVADAMREVVRERVPIVLFAEGTSTNGETVLPFKPALFAAVTNLDVPITPCAIDYSLKEGSVADEVCYWGTHEFVPHVLNLFGKIGLSARVSFGEPRSMSSNRKEMARTLREDVIALRESH